MAQKWPKLAQIWPKMALEWPKMIQNGPKITQNGPKLPKMAGFTHFFRNFSLLKKRFSKCFHFLNVWVQYDEILRWCFWEKWLSCIPYFAPKYPIFYPGGSISVKNLKNVMLQVVMAHCISFHSWNWSWKEMAILGLAEPPKPPQGHPEPPRCPWGPKMALIYLS